MIKLTDSENGKQLTINQDHIIAYWRQSGDHTYIMLNGENKNYATVTETPTEIDRILQNAP